jgi:hypothetical protein
LAGSGRRATVANRSKLCENALMRQFPNRRPC